MSSCATGCYLPGQHVPTAVHPADHPCLGCLPRRTAPGRVVCWRCSNGLEDALVRAPDLVAHIRDQVVPGDSGGTDGLPGAGRLDGPAPLSLGAVADADDLHALLCSWAALVAETYPGGLCGPGWVGTHRPRGNDRPAVGLTTAGDWRATATVTRWLYDHLEWELTQEWAPDYVREVSTLVRRLRDRWATEERPRYLPVPCPSCKDPSLIRYAPTVWQGPVTITCQSCGIVVPEREFGAFVHTIAQERRARRKVPA